MQVATQILEQLGGNRFAAMTGAKQFVGGERSLQFSLGRGATNKANKVRVTLAGDDTYTVEFFNLRGVNLKPCGEPVERVYADRLAAVFTEATGFDTRL
jgi:hypothetical protein